MGKNSAALALLNAVRVVFVSYGIHTDQGAKFHQYCLDNPEVFYVPLDIRKILWNDPWFSKRYKVLHTSSGDDPKTQVAILDDPRYYDAVLHVWKHIQVDYIDQGVIPKILPGYCSQVSIGLTRSSRAFPTGFLIKCVHQTANAYLMRSASIATTLQRKRLWT